MALDRSESRGFEDDASNLAESVDDSVDFQQRLEVSAESKTTGLRSWKPFRAFVHVGQQKLNCVFTVHVHAI